MPQCSAISIVPPELIAEIFIRVNTCGGPKGKITDGLKLKGALLVARVCRHWCTVAFAEPRLWDSISVTLARDDHESQAAALSAWLMRSGSCLLSLSLSCDVETVVETHPALSLITASSSRWAEVDLELPPHLLEQLRPARGSLPALKRLDITEIQQKRYGVRYPVYDFASSAPLLRSLYSEISPNRLSLPWSQIQDLCLSWILRSQLFELLRTVPQLRTLKAKNIFAGRNDTHSGLISLPHLHSLEVGLAQDNSVWIDNLIFPALRHLVIDAVLLPSLFLLERSKCSLEKLHINGYQIEDVVLEGWLTAMPSLIRLELRPKLTQRIVRLLTPTTPETSCLCPRLTVLRLCDISPDAEAATVQMILSRMEGKGGTLALQDVYLGMKRPGGWGGAAEFEKYRAQGVNIVATSTLLY